MKTKDVISITLKIIGLIALWKAVQNFGAVIIGFGVFTNINESNRLFMIAIGLSIILNFLLPSLLAFIFLFKTEKVLSIIKFDEQSQIDLNTDKQTLYHMIIVIFGFLIIMHGAGNFISFKYNTDTKTEYINNNMTENNQTPDTNNQRKVTVTNSSSKNINYFGLIEIILGIVLLTKTTEISKRVEKSFDSKSSEIS